MQSAQERRLLQICVAIAALVPILAGLGGAALGQRFLDSAAPIDLSLDSHVRFLSGLLCAIGLVFWSTTPQIERHTLLFGRLTMIVVAGGLARLYGILIDGPPPAPMLFGLFMELVITPALWAWQWRVARRWAEETGRVHEWR